MRRKSSESRGMLTIWSGQFPKKFQLFFWCAEMHFYCSIVLKPPSPIYYKSQKTWFNILTDLCSLLLDFVSKYQFWIYLTRIFSVLLQLGRVPTVPRQLHASHAHHVHLVQPSKNICYGIKNIWCGRYTLVLAVWRLIMIKHHARAVTLCTRERCTALIILGNGDHSMLQ